MYVLVMYMLYHGVAFIFKYYVLIHLVFLKSQKVTKKEVRHKRDLLFHFAFWYELIIFRNYVSTFMFRFKLFAS